MEAKYFVSIDRAVLSLAAPLSLSLSLGKITETFYQRYRCDCNGNMMTPASPNDCQGGVSFFDVSYLLDYIRVCDRKRFH